MSLTFVSPPRMSAALFQRVLERAHSPAAAEATALYQTCVVAGIDPAVALAFYKHESTFGTAGINVTYNLKNWGSVRRAFDLSLAIGTVTTPDNGTFARYASWNMALLDWCLRITHRYVEMGLDTVALAIPKYAPASDGNTPLAYIAAVEKAVAGWIAEDTGPMALTIDSATYRSPNFNGRGGTPISGIVLHTTEGAWPSDAEWLSSEASQVSAHYVISPQSKVYQLVDDTHRAWHAGVGTYLGISDWNTPSIGIEVSHLENHTWPAGQRDVLRELCLMLIAKYGIKAPMIAAHRWIAPDRRRDPTDFPDSDLKPWIAALYGPPVWDGPPGTVPVDARLKAYWERSGGTWKADRATLGYAVLPMKDGIQLFERGAVRLRSDGVIQALLLREAVALLPPIV